MYNVYIYMSLCKSTHGYVCAMHVVFFAHMPWKISTKEVGINWKERHPRFLRAYRLLETSWSILARREG